MSRAAVPSPAAPATGGAGERLAVVALTAIVVVLGFVRFFVLPAQTRPERIVFDYRNPLLDAQPGERAVWFTKEHPNIQTCTVVRPEGVVLRPHAGPRRIAEFGGLRRAQPYLPCTMREARGAEGSCSGAERETVLYALNYFGMPHDTDVRAFSIQPRWMRWGQRDLVVYEVVLERYGTLGGRWTTYQTTEAPVAGLVKWASLLPHHTEVHYRDLLPTDG